MSEPSTLDTPLLLLAMPQVLDPFFHKSVVLLVQHEEEGSLGFIVNRPTELKISEILEDLEVSWGGEEDSSAFFGGPVNPEVGTLVYLDKTSEDDGKELIPGVSATQSVNDLDLLSRLPADSFRLFLGYAGWGEGQLEQELLRNDWLIAPVKHDLIFTDTPDDMWRQAFESVGVNPDLLAGFNPDGSNVN